jgi:DNA modification methylase
VATQPFKEAHFATFPPDLIEPCILAGCPEGGTVLDPFGGSGTTGLVADRLGRNAILIELNPEYAAMARRRIEGDAPLFAEVDT